MNNIYIERIREEHLSKVARLEQAIFSDAWSEQALSETFRQSYAVILGAWAEDMLAGYVILYCIADQGEIMRIAVDEALRRRGVARQLLEETLRYCKQNGADTILLDVRESNQAAISLYKKHGYIEDGIRKNFYTNPSEDAILMHCEVAE